MVNGNGTFVYNGYDADGSWYPPVEPVIPRVYHEKARDFNIKDILYPWLNKDNDEEEGGEDEPTPIPVEPGPVIIDPDEPTDPDSEYHF